MSDNPTDKDLKKFRITLLLFPIIPAVIFYFKNKLVWGLSLVGICWAFLALMLIFNLVKKGSDKYIYFLIHAILKAAGVVLSVIALVFTWICTILPTGIVAKWAKRDRLLLKKPKTQSYWKDVPVKEATYENQY